MRKILTIEKLGGEGVGIAHLNGKTVFIPYVIPGDVVTAELTRETSSYCKAKLVKIERASGERIDPRCGYFGSCGGCSHQNLSYENQLKYKKELLREIFRKFLNDTVEIDDFVPSPKQFAYRNKLQMQCAAAKNRGIIGGFYRAASHEIVEIKHCPLHSDEINSLASETLGILNEFKIPAYGATRGKGMIRDIVIRESEKTKRLMLTIVSNSEDLPRRNTISKILFKRIPLLEGLFLYSNPHDTDIVFKDSRDIGLGEAKTPLKKIFGGFIHDGFGGIDFTISPISFFQVNAPQALNILDYIRELLKDEDTRSYSLIDAYAGIGALSLPLAKYFKSILAIELVNHAASLGRKNASQNGITNYSVRNGDACEVIGKMASDMGLAKFIERNRYILLDPPRSGLSEEMREMLCTISFKRIIYISCDPHTQARDVEKLTKDGGYRIRSIRPFDMFPQTFHIENVITLESD